jgi:hypothetical protein
MPDAGGCCVSTISGMDLLRSGRFWMVVWLATLGAVLAWAVVTVAFFLDSVKNLSLMSVAALLLATAAGVQTTLAMRKADDDDDL